MPVAVAIAFGMFAATASAHIERASYWPDPAADTAGGVPTGGEVPAYRPLSTALDPAPPGDTRVVCQGGPLGGGGPGPGPGPGGGGGTGTSGGTPLTATRASQIHKLLARLRRKLRKAKKKGDKKKVRRLKRRIRALRQQLAAGRGADVDPASHPSIVRLNESLEEAVDSGYVIRPSEDPLQISQAEADQLRALNLALLDACAYDNIQDAVTDSGNNDRVVVMPGIYTEPKSRAAPTNDPRCDGLEEVNDRGQTGANSYRYVATCPNDQNLIAIIGRDLGGVPPQPPLEDRHNIPDEGPCIRCNFQLEGSGISADDVIVDAGRVESGNGSPADPVKDVGIRADRADGFVLRNMTVRHVREHGIYTHEVDGYRLERFKTFHAEEYGTLNFTSDHGLMQDCEAYGSGDAGLYPGSAPDTGEQTIEDGGPRYNTEITRCDMHHNTAGYSGTAANAVWLHHNDFYDNALGFTTDVFTAAGHPGFPQDSDLIENNEFYSNNFNPYVDQPDNDEVVPTIPVPVGTGMWIAGGNNNIFRNNRVWDNWRRGSMLFSVPDVFVCGPDSGTAGEQVFGCDPTKVNTSFRNRFRGNAMSQRPDGTPDPNGTDFWWDEFPLNTGNCWYDNTGKDGTRASLTSSPPLGPIPGASLPQFLPEDCDESIGTSGAEQDGELLSCLANFEEGAPTPCTWFETPTEPAP